jgi:hypothetical protein
MYDHDEEAPFWQMAIAGAVGFCIAVGLVLGAYHGTGRVLEWLLGKGI